jgi:hypothetical protein
MATKSTPSKNKDCMGNPPRKKKDWTDYYSARGGGILQLQDLFDEPLGTYDKVTLSYLLDGKGLPEAVESHHFNWVLIPGPAKSVRIFHD